MMVTEKKKIRKALLIFLVLFVTGCGLLSREEPDEKAEIPTLIILGETEKQESTSEPADAIENAIDSLFKKTKTSEIDGMEMVYVPAGEFTMGTSNVEIDQMLVKNPDLERSWFETEYPQHEAYLDAYWIDKYEVTNAQFELFVDSTRYETDAEQTGSAWVCTGDNCEEINGADWEHPQGPDSSINRLMEHPVIQVSWNDASAYCEWAGRRLPSEAEWEKAARGTDLRLYPWGDSFDGSLLNYCDQNCLSYWADKNGDDGYENTSPVGSYSDGASPYDAVDMAGNVWEWTADWFGEEYYSKSPSRNPTGPSTGEAHILRGGSWFKNNMNIRSASRGWFFPNVGSNDYGFRCAVNE